MAHSSFTKEQLTILEGVLHEYREISGQEKVKRKEAIITRVTWQFVTVHHENDMEAMKKLQNSVRNWLNNRSRELTDEEEYFQKTNWFMVFASENSDQIKKETQNLTNIAPGSPGYTYVDMAVEWNTKGVPKDVQMKQVRLHLAAFLQQVSVKMYRQFSIRMMMFWGYKSDGEIFRGIHDHNDSLDDGPMVKKVCPNWDKEPIGSTWEKYLQSAFSATKQASLPTVVDSKKKFEVKKAEDGHWNLPPEDFMTASLEQQKQLVRDFMNCCWQDMAGRKGSTSFSKMTKDLREFVDLDARYLPDKPSLEIKDPSHMSKDNVECLLHHWRERQGNQFLWPIFAFKETTKQSQKKTAQTSPNITQITSCNVITTPSEASRPTTTPATPPPNDSPGSIVAVSQQSKAGEPSPNAEQTAKVPQPITLSFLQTDCNDGSIDGDSSDESSSDSDESDNAVDLWQSPYQHGATVEGQVEFLRSLSDRKAYLGLINILHLTQVKTGSMLIHDAEIVAGGQTPLSEYPFIPPELKGKTIPGHYISGYILPWCKRLSEQLKESHAEGISHRPHQSPADVKGKWHKARDFMLCLSSDKQYRQLVMALEQIDNSGSPDQDCARGVPLLSDFSWDTLSHHAGDVPHESWAMAFKAISSVGLSDPSGEKSGRWYIALHAAFVGMVLHNVAMSKSTSATCAYPSIPSFVASTRITDSCIADAIQWCKVLRRTIMKAPHHKPTAQK
ncbi:hypothetical protein HYDPIDRAFT_33499 [Hydnomerulius pinastri MD-312]|uniref:Uncharacterized protein n=1 Tax=Hydnomerulius pinastri MD-312 TaxID=994086 RepID=A0A0C9V1H6_9AGAM|nr:hypothetical protein HYDPIDRAFT_33499 [Hydnomerulius pinastri MD-312]